MAKTKQRATLDDQRAIWRTQRPRERLALWCAADTLAEMLVSPHDQYTTRDEIMMQVDRIGEVINKMTWITVK